MVRPSDRDYQKAVKMIHSGQLNYESALLCMDVMKAYLTGQTIHLDDLNRFKHLLQIDEISHI
jgi:hypothetical protein